MSFAYLTLYTGDYLRDTRHLTPLRHGIYLLSLMYCWDTQGPMPVDEQECAGICNCRSADEIEALRYILGRYFVLMEDGWYQPRMQREIERAESLSRARSDAGRKGFQARAKQLPSKCQASAKQEHLSPSPSPSPSSAQNPREEPPPPPAGGVRDFAQFAQFAQFWDAYPRKTDRKRAETTWDRLAKGDQEAALADIKAGRFADTDKQFIPHPTTYLRGRRWEDEPVSTQMDWDDVRRYAGSAVR